MTTIYHSFLIYYYKSFIANQGLQNSYYKVS